MEWKKLPDDATINPLDKGHSRVSAIDEAIKTVPESERANTRMNVKLQITKVQIMQELELDAKQEVDRDLKYWQSQNIKIEAGTKPTQAFINTYGNFSQDLCGIFGSKSALLVLIMGVLAS